MIVACGRSVTNVVAASWAAPGALKAGVVARAEAGPVATPPVWQLSTAVTAAQLLSKHAETG